MLTEENFKEKIQHSWITFTESSLVILANIK